MERSTLSIVIVVALGFALAGCRSDKGEPIPLQPLSNVPIAPLWQDSMEQPTGLQLAGCEIYPVPDPSSWYPPVGMIWPVILSRQENGFCFYGTHIERNWFWSKIGDFGTVDGFNRWNPVTGQKDIIPFGAQDEASQFLFVLNIPDKPGVEFGRLYYPQDQSHNTSTAEIFVYDTSGRKLETITPGVPCWGPTDLMRYAPLEYPDTSLTMLWDELNRESGGKIIDFSKGSVSTDPRSSNSALDLPPRKWVAETGEWITSPKYEGEGDAREVWTIVKEDSTVKVFDPRTWPDCPDWDTKDWIFLPPEIAPFYLQGHRCFLFGLGNDLSYSKSSPSGDSNQQWWAVQVDYDDTMTRPIWCREEPFGDHMQQEFLTIGPDKHPFWVRFYPLSKVLRIIDLATGNLALELTVPIATRLRKITDAALVLRMSKDRDIPSIFIFDPTGEKLVRIDLEIP
jgi:hypothetical protein